MPVFNLQKAKAAGYTPEQIQAFLAKRPDLSVGGVNAPSAQPQKDEGLSGWLPTIGSIAGGVVGAPLGPAGIIGGSALGGGVGEFARQAVGGKQIDTGSIVKEAALGGAGGVVGKIAGPVLKGAGKFASGGARALVGKAPVAAAEGATKAVGPTGNILERMGQKLGTKALRLQPSQLTKFTQRHGEDVEQFLTTEKAIGKGSRALETQHIAPLQKQFNAIAKESGLTAQPADFNKNIETKIAELLKAGGSENAELAGKIKKEAQYIIKNDLTKNNFGIEKIDELRRTFAGKVNWNDPAKATVDYAIADALRKTAIDTADSAGMPGLKEIGIRLSKFRDLDLYATAQENLGRGNKPMGITNWLATIGGLSLGDGGVGGALGLLANLATNNTAVMGAGARGLMAAGGSQALKTAAEKTGQVIGGTTAQTGTRAALSPKEAEASQPQPEENSSFVDFNINSQQDNPDMMSDFTTAPKSKDQLRQLIGIAALKSAKNTADVIKAYEFMTAKSGGAGSNVGITSAKDYGLAKSGLKNVETMWKLYQKDPDVLTKQLVPGQFFSRKFDSAVYDAADTLLRLRTGAQANPDEIRGYMKKIAPTFGDTPDDVLFKVQKMVSDLKSYAQGGTATGSPIADFGGIGE